MQNIENSYIDRAYEEYMKGSYGEAVDLFELSLNWYEDNRKGMLTTEDKYYEYSLMIAEMYFSIGNVYGDIYLDYDNKAKEKYTMPHAINWNKASFERMMKVNYAVAKTHYKRCIEVKPRRSEAYNEMGNILLKLGQYSEAEKVFLKAYYLQPQNQVICNNVASCYSYRGLYNKAVPYAEKAIELSVNDLRELEKQLKEGKEDVGSKELEGQKQALSIMNSNIAFLYLNLCDFKKAYQLYQMAIEFYSDNDNARYGITYMEENKLIPKGWVMSKIKLNNNFSLIVQIILKKIIPKQMKIRR
ncbi:MAG TPA: hypothetical protein DCP90_00665 [Clostridiales bacterium]|nr:MAG: hypothetical protein A2Y22_08075 [Clostridiales bacterium GWD2_32_59]HAN09109.1 hypothetical protein [Clostridiales bacterium]